MKRSTAVGLLLATIALGAWWLWLAGPVSPVVTPSNPPDGRAPVGDVQVRDDALAPANEDRRTVDATSISPTAENPAPVEVATLRMRVVDAARRPIPDATLAFCRVGNTPRGIAALEDPSMPSARSGADGSIEWVATRDALSATGIGSDAQHVGATFVVRADGWRMVEVRTWLRIGRIVDEGDIVLARGKTLEGRVLDATGQPVGGALVATRSGTAASSATARWPGFQRPPHTLTRDDGSYELHGVPSELVCVVAFADPRGTSNAGPFGQTCSVDLRLLPEIKGVDVVLDRGALPEHCIAGRVRDAEGRGLSGILIGIAGTTPSVGVSGLNAPVRLAGDFPLSATTGADGRFACACSPSFADAIARNELTVRVRDPLWKFGERNIPSIRLGQNDLDIVLAPARHIAIDVIDDAGRSLADGVARVARGRNVRWTILSARSSGDPPVLRVPTPEAPFDVEVSARGHESTWLGPFQDPMVPGHVTAVLPRRTGITGQVVFETGAVVGAEVALVRLKDPKAGTASGGEFDRRVRDARLFVETAIDTTTTTRDGRFEVFTDVIDDRTSSATGDPRLALRIHTVGASALVVLPNAAWSRPYDCAAIRLEKTAVLDGRVRGGTEGDLIAFDRGDGRVAVAHLGADGTFRVDDVGAGTWRFARIRRDPIVSPWSKGETAAARWIDDRGLDDSARAAFEVPTGSSLFVELDAPPQPTAVTIALSFGDMFVDSIEARVTPVDPTTGSAVVTDPAWDAHLPVQVLVDRPGQFELTVRARIASSTLVVSDTIWLTPGEPKAWQLSATLTELPIPAAAVPIASGSRDALTQQVRPECAVTSFLVPARAGFQPAFAVVGVAGRVIRFAERVDAWLSPGDVERAITLMHVPPPLPGP